MSSKLRDVPKPVPKDDEVLVRIRATTVSAADCELREVGTSSSSSHSRGRDRSLPA